MLRSKAVTRIQETLGFRSDQETGIIERLQEAQQMLERRAELPWFLLTEISTISTTADEERIPVPSDMLREWEEDPLWYFNSTADAADQWVELVKDDLANLRGRYPGTGSPKAYALDDINFRILPVPDDTYPLKMIYYKTDVVLSSDVENLWLEHLPYLMIGKAGALLSPALRDEGATKQFNAWAAEGLALLKQDNETRLHVNRRYVMGGPD